jgi:hypothetical protein
LKISGSTAFFRFKVFETADFLTADYTDLADQTENTPAIRAIGVIRG